MASTSFKGPFKVIQARISEIMSARHSFTLDLYKVTCIGVLMKKVQSQDLVVERPPRPSISWTSIKNILDLYVPDNHVMHDPDNRAMHDTGSACRRIYRGTHIQAMWSLDEHIPFDTGRSGRVALGDKESDGGKGLAGTA